MDISVIPQPSTKSNWIECAQIIWRWTKGIETTIYFTQSTRVLIATDLFLQSDQLLWIRINNLENLA